MTAEIIRTLPTVNNPQRDDVEARSPRRKRSRAFAREGVSWTPALMDHLRLPHKLRGLSSTFKQLAVDVRLHGGRLHLAWKGLAARFGKATSTVRLHLAELVRLGLAALQEAGGGRIRRGAALVGRANVYGLTELGWRVCRGLDPWPMGPPAPAPAETVGEANRGGNLPIVGTQLEGSVVEKRTVTPPPTPSPEKEAATPDGPDAVQFVVPGGPDVFNAPAGARSTALVGKHPPKTPRQTAQGAPRSTLGTGRGWSRGQLADALLRAGEPPAAIQGAIDRALAEGVGAPLQLARWFCRVAWPKKLAEEAARQAEREARAGAEEATRRKVREKMREDDTLKLERGPCPHTGGLTCPLCLGVGRSVCQTFLLKLRNYAGGKS